MDNLYEQFIRQTVTEFYPKARPHIQVSRASLDAGHRVERVHALGLQLPEGLLKKLVEIGRSTEDLSSLFVLNPKVDHSRSYYLELDDQHYSQRSVKGGATIRFGFSLVASDEGGRQSLFYATHDRGPLAGAGLLCLAEGDEMRITAAHCLCMS